MPVLHDGILIKENHIVAAGSIAEALNAAQELNRNIPIQIEVESVDELLEALNAGASLILLDNFDLGKLRSAVRSMPVAPYWKHPGMRVWKRYARLPNRRAAHFRRQPDQVGPRD